MSVHFVWVVFTETRRRGSVPLELEFWMLLSHQALSTESKFSARAAGGINHRALSLVLLFSINTSSYNNVDDPTGFLC